MPEPRADEPATEDVLLIDDHLALSEGLALLLRRAGMRVAGATDTPEQGLELAASRRPRVVLLDLDLGGEEGVAWLASLRSVAPECRVLIYTAAQEPGVLEAALATDVAGVILKSCSSAELVEALHAVAEGRHYIDPRLTELLHNALGEDLSRRERQVLELLARGRTGEQVAVELFLSPETVRTHVRNAMRKLGAQTRAQAVVMALKAGRIVVPSVDAE